MDFGCPAPSDIRPMRFEEFEAMWDQVLFVSATPGLTNSNTAREKW